jgi:hypothetical protein
MRNLGRLEQLATLCGMEPSAAVSDLWLEYDPNSGSMIGPPRAADPAMLRTFDQLAALDSMVPYVRE